MKRKDDFLLQTVGGRHLLIPIGARVMDMNGLVALNATATHMWQLLEERHTLDELVAAQVARFDVDEETARFDVCAFVDVISEIGLLET
jgi:predicted TPR repeat methyltransferase